MPLLKTYEEARLLWDTKGWGLGAVAKHLAEDPKLAAFKFSQPTLSRRVDDAEPIPPPVAEAIEALETRRGCQRPTEIVEEGLRAAHEEPTQREARELALALLAHFPTSALALKLVDALLAQAQVASGNGSLLDVFAQAIAGRLPHVPKLKTAKLARLLAKRIAHKLPMLSFGRLAFVAGVASIVACGVWTLLDSTRNRSRPANAPVSLTLYLGADRPPLVFDARAFLDVVELGEKAPLDQGVPDRPLLGQKLPPCDASLAQEEIGGGCWAGMKTKPPCGRLYRRGDTCYLPVAADPQRPVGSDASRAPAP